MDGDEPPSQGNTPDHTTTPSFSGVDANSSFRSNRRSRASRTSERESLEEEIRRTVKGLRAQADAERRRADAAERKVREITAHLQAVNDARLEALRDAGRAKEELRLYKIQLDTAQKEIYRAQDVIGTVDRQRHDAEKDAARSRTRARQLHEAILVQTAREEAYRLGMQEGLDRGRAIGHVEPPPSGEEEYGEEYTDDGQSDGGFYRDPPRRQRSIMAPSGHSRADSRSQALPTALPVPPPVDVLPVNPPSNYAPSVRAPSVRPTESMRGRSPNPSYAPQSNYAPSMRGPSPNPSMTRPPSNYAPSVRGPSPNPSNARPPSNYAPSMRAASPNPSLTRPPSTYAPSMRGPSPNPSNARPPSTYAPSMRAASPNPSYARPPSIRARSPGPSYSRAPSTHAPSIRAPSVSEGAMGRPASVLSFAPTPHHATVPVPPDNLIPTLDADMRIRLPPPHEFMARTPEPAPSSDLPLAAPSESSVTSQEPLPVPLRSGAGAAPGRTGRHRRGSSAGSGSSTLSTLELFSNPYGGGMRTPMSAIEEVSSQASPAHHAEGHHGRSFSENSAGRHATPSVRGEDRPPSRSSYAGSWMHPPASVAPADDRRSQRSYNSDAPKISVQPPSLSNKTESQRGASPAPSQRGTQMPGGFSGYYQPPPAEGPPVVPIEPLRYQPRQPALQGQIYDDDAVSSALTADTLTTPPQMYRPEVVEGGRGW